MKVLTLTHGQQVLLDDEDYEYISQWRWQLNNNGYPRRTAKLAGTPDKTQLLHKVVATRVGLHGEVDHKDRNKLNCIRRNLRLATRTQQCGNTERKRDSGYKGVKKESRTKTATWTARITINGCQTHLGTFGTPEEAALAYNKAALKHFGEFAFLNTIL
jgi:hypothetical protein